MSKDKEKLNTNSKKRRKTDNSNATVSRQNRQHTKTSYFIDDGIAVSRQLAQKMKKNGSFGRPRKHVSKNINNEPRICGNGKPMPSLADLEKMFDDSDDDSEEPKVNNCTNVTPSNRKPVGCSTPKKPPTISEDKLKSPSTIKTIADKMLDFISNLSDTTILLDDGPPPPVIPQKKRKKPDVPYIVGCKDRPKVVRKPTTKFCKGDDDYGVDPNDVNSDDDYPKQRAKRSRIANVSKSIFNAKSDEIAARLKECDSDGSSDSNKTVAYEYYTPYKGTPRSFSPLPSTSKDNETILKNDIRFNESLIGEQLTSKGQENDLEIINQPLDTIDIDNEIKNKSVQPVVPDTSFIVIDDYSPPHTPNDNKITENTSRCIDDDSCIEIVENKISKVDDFPIPVEDYYSTVDFNNPCDDDIIEVPDIDDVIAESNAVLKKYSKFDDLDSVTLVEPQINCKDIPSEETNAVVDHSYATPSKPGSPKSSLLPNIPTDTAETAIIVNHHNLNHSSNMTGNNIITIENSCRQNISDVEFISSMPRDDTSAVEYVSTTPSPRKPPVQNAPQLLPRHENIIENVVTNFFNQTSRETQSNTSSLHDNQNSACNSHNHQANGTCILSLLQSMHDLAKNLNSNMNKKKSKKKANNKQPQIIPPIPAPETRNEPQQISKGLGDCPICMDSLASTQVASTICGHIFCMNCISAAVKRSGKRCPTCRKPLKGAGYHPIFL